MMADDPSRAMLMRMLHALAPFAMALSCKHDGCDDTAFVWEPELDQRPLITFRDLRLAQRVFNASFERFIGSPCSFTAEPQPAASPTAEAPPTE